MLKNFVCSSGPYFAGYNISAHLMRLSHNLIARECVLKWHGADSGMIKLF